MNSTRKTLITLLVLSLLVYNTIAISVILKADVTEDPVCKNVTCGEGKCMASSSTLLGYQCQCFEGWKQIEAGLFPTPCSIPNCSVDLHCGGNTPPQSFAEIPVFEFSNPCNLVWCNYGKCVANGTGHYCQCQPNNENLFDNPAFACFPQCALGADCKKVGLGPTPPSPTSAGSPNTMTGSGNEGNCLRKVQGFTIIVLSAALHVWV